jgi:hypothetical protein
MGSTKGGVGGGSKKRALPAARQQPPVEKNTKLCFILLNKLSISRFWAPIRVNPRKMHKKGNWDAGCRRRAPGGRGSAPICQAVSYALWRDNSYSSEDPSRERQVICTENDAADAATASVLRDVDAFEMPGVMLASFKKAMTSRPLIAKLTFCGMSPTRLAALMASNFATTIPTTLPN